MVWDYLKRERFFGMIIPKEYDGIGLSPRGNSAVVAKLTSRSLPLANTVKWCPTRSARPSC